MRSRVQAPIVAPYEHSDTTLRGGIFYVKLRYNRAMIPLTTSIVDTVTKKQRLPTTFRKRLYVARLDQISNDDWTLYELFALPTKDTAAGLLFLESNRQLYAARYEISPISHSTGRAKPVICDFCKTWQSGTRAATITFRTKRSSANSISYLCCADLACSLHVRTLTSSAKMSRAQLREHLTTEQRVERLTTGIDKLVDRLNLTSIQ